MESIIKKKIIITGHPYAFPYYRRVFDYALVKSDFIFVLPKIWKSRIAINLKKDSKFIMYGLNTVSYGGKSLLRGLFKGWMPEILILVPYLRIKHNARVLYSCSEPNLLTTLLNGTISKLLGLKFVIFTWQNVEPEKRLSGLKLKFSNLLVLLNLKIADGVICGNKKAAAIITRYKKDSNILLSPLSGVDIEKFKPGLISNWKDRLNIGEDKIILFFGALEKRKGVDILLSSFHGLSDYPIKLIIVGTGLEKNNLVQQVKELNLVDRVLFIDWMDNSQLPSLICAADIFVYPSVPFNGWEEQFGYAMAEASACGVPVISTKTGSIEEVVLDGETGILVKPDDVDDLRAGIIRLLDDSRLRHRLGDSGRRYISERYGHKKVATEISDFLYKFYL